MSNHATTAFEYPTKHTTNELRQLLEEQRFTFNGSHSDDPPEGITTNHEWRMCSIIDGNWIENSYGISLNGIEQVMETLITQCPGETITNGKICQALSHGLTCTCEFCCPDPNQEMSPEDTQYQ